MLGFLFGFNARLGRLHFFFATIALAILMTAICFAIAASLLGRVSAAALRPEDLMTSWATIAAIAFFAVATFTLQCMRIRDIGWDPVCVVPAWIALMIVDHLVAARFPALAVGNDHQATVVGALVNFVLMLALYFWPGGDDRESSGRSDRPSGWRRDRTDSSIATERLARASQGGDRRPSWT